MNLILEEEDSEKVPQKDFITPEKNKKDPPPIQFKKKGIKL